MLISLRSPHRRAPAIKLESEEPREDTHQLRQKIGKFRRISSEEKISLVVESIGNCCLEEAEVERARKNGKHVSIIFGGNLPAFELRKQRINFSDQARRYSRVALHAS